MRSPKIQWTLAIFILATLCFVGSITAVLAGDSNSEAPKTQPAPPKTLDELQQAIHDSLVKNHVPGVGLALVARDHVIWAGGVGNADVAAHKPVTADTNFRVGSVSKGFVALSLLQLQEKRRVDLNAPVKTIAPEIPIENPWDSTDPVRVVNLLEHTAGFDDMHFNEVYNVTDAPDIPLRDVFTRFTDPQHVRWRPGTRMSYSNPGYGLAGYLIEKITGQKFENYIQRNILNPLGMTHSSFLLTDDIRSHLSNGYDGDPPKSVPYQNIYLRPAGNLMSTPADMALWVRMMLNRGTLDGKEIVKSESITRMENPATTSAARAGLQAGYGLGNYYDVDHAIVAHGHDGGIAGFISDYRYLPDQGVGYVILFNSGRLGSAYEDIGKLVFNYITAGDPATQQAAVQVPPAKLEELTGSYQAENPRSQLLGFMDQLQGVHQVYFEGGALHEKPLLGGKTETLVPVGNNQFRREKDPIATEIFFTATDGRQILGNGGGLYAERVNGAIPVLRLALVIAAIVLMATSILFALIWIPLKLAGRMKDVKNLRVRLLPLLAVLCLILAFYAAIATFNMANPGAMAVPSVILWTATWLFTFFSIWALVAALSSFSTPMKPLVRWHSLLVSLACCGVFAYLAWWHVIGLKVWSY
jgi:CubicO group peptidase (beta-lactamase class C family)